MKLNPARLDYADKLRELIDRYNAGSKNIDEFFDELRRLADDLNDEQERHIREQLTEEELAVFDILTKPDPVLSATDEAKVKKVARDLLARLKRELLVLDWRNRQVTRAAVQVGIEEALDAGLPDAYDRQLFARKAAGVYEHVFEKYQGNGVSVYESVA